MVDTWEELDSAVNKARDFDPKVIVEAGAKGKRELECAVIQELDGKPVASVVGEITVAEDSAHEFYDFEAKYLDGTSLNVVPADIPVTLSERIRTYAVQAFEAVGCEGLARVDFFLTDDGLVINEINTMPGFTPYSMFPVLWQASGMSYAELVDRLIQLALSRETGLALDAGLLDRIVPGHGVGQVGEGVRLRLVVVGDLDADVEVATDRGEQVAVCVFSVNQPTSSTMSHREAGPRSAGFSTPQRRMIARIAPGRGVLVLDQAVLLAGDLQRAVAEQALAVDRRAGRGRILVDRQLRSASRREERGAERNGEENAPGHEECA